MELLGHMGYVAGFLLTIFGQVLENGTGYPVRYVVGLIGDLPLIKRVCAYA
jgi:hypothetical protein